MMRQFKYFIIVILLILLKCTWTPRTVLPEYLRVLYIPTAGNNTLQPGLSDSLTKQVIEEFELDGRLTTSKHVSNAQGVLFCTIVKYKKVPISYTDLGEIDTTKLILGVNIKLRDIKSGEWISDGDIEEELEYNHKSEPVETEVDAQARLIKQIAPRIVSKTIEGW